VEYVYGLPMLQSSCIESFSQSELSSTQKCRIRRHISLRCFVLHMLCAYCWAYLQFALLRVAILSIRIPTRLRTLSLTRLLGLHLYT